MATTTAALLEAVRGLHVADPDLGVKPLVAKLREQQPDLGAVTKEVRKALMALKAEAADAPPVAEALPAGSNTREAPFFLKCLTAGDGAGLREALRQGLDPNTVVETPAVSKEEALRHFPSGYTPNAAELEYAMHSATRMSILSLATVCSTVECVVALLDHSARLDAPDLGQLSALRAAVENDVLTTAGVLLRARAQVNASAQGGVLSLHIASQRGNVPMMELLLQAGASMTASNDAGYMAIHLSCRMGHQGTVSTLLQAKASAKARTASEQWRTPLYFASEQGHCDVVRVLLSALVGAEVDEGMHSGYTNVYVAASNGRDEALSLLLRAGASVNLPNDEGNTPLHGAAAHNRLKSARILIDHSASLDAASSGGSPGSRRRLASLRWRCPWLW